MTYLIIVYYYSVVAIVYCGLNSIPLVVWLVALLFNVVACFEKL